MSAVTLADVAQLVGDAQRRGDARLSSICHDSRHVMPGALFCALRGRRSDGHEHAAAAVKAGAVALLVDHFLDIAVPQLQVPSVRRALGVASAAIWGWPSRRLRMAGVTGTDGKTTTAYLLEACLSAQGRRTGLLGTVETKMGREHLPSVATTPEAPDLHAALARMVGRRVEDVVMEVSSHALDQGRVDGIEFEVGVFTNLTAEHLDYHGTIEQYFATKSRLFEPGRCAHAVIGVDDEWGRRLAAQARIPVTTFGTNPAADVVMESVSTGRHGTRVRIRGGSHAKELQVPYPGQVNAANAVAAHTAARVLGVGPRVAAAALAAAPPIRGRFQVVDPGHPVSVVVDYAHTPRALGNLIQTGKQLAGKGRVIVVTGVAGERDRWKRPALGREAARADLTIFTDETPGHEDPAAIVAQLSAGTLGVDHAKVEVELDRARAIELAITRALPGDMVLVAGRGHERSFHRGDDTVALDDTSVAREALRKWHRSRRGQALAALLA
ncbi:MAG: UDP-N-acetylmuramoyl-L-alanyl-D-glutamate--2,6-diaminopimelate ligase [Acidimicrobiales bacterium]|nr:UDP-N-acetylmuramoyl-L-alanyl-D-glutamate--2,6-diaminopimelate ligase [Acidimicrobiales bacterium]MBO0893257.1 UDP-N-acetylmuramoyl-L-alanyl-D-glutamate--2,6-diaminopimelate ligase [Acidimicrobiales bacterium]